jgi:cytidine deaminase
MKIEDTPPEQEQAALLIEAARSAAQQAYAPYSSFRVGAALLLTDGSVTTGANIENASYGLTLCAERSALARAINEHGPAIRIQAIAVANLNSAPSAPCGACRQVLAEFAAPDAWIAFPFGDHLEIKRFADLLPFAFGLSDETTGTKTRR